MGMGNLISEYKVKNTYFQLLAYILIVFAIAYMVNSYGISDKNYIFESITGGLIAFFAGLLFLYLGSKTKTIKLYQNGLEYLIQRVMFRAKWDEIAVVKSFQDRNKQTENLIIITEDERLLDISTAFFNKEKLMEAFNQIIKIVKTKENITIEDDRLWIKDSNE
jgi:hypothetical protein